MGDLDLSFYEVRIYSYDFIDCTQNRTNKLKNSIRRYITQDDGHVNFATNCCEHFELSFSMARHGILSNDDKIKFKEFIMPSIRKYIKINKDDDVTFEYTEESSEARVFFDSLMISKL
jgi:hypothetical protein